MKFSTRTVYGLKAVLALAVRYGEGSLSASQIAKKEGISVAYLEQILHTLKKKGFVKSVRGPQGGYGLVKNPSQTTLLSFFYLLTGKDPFEDYSKVSSLHELHDSAIANFIFWKKFATSIEKTLSEVTLTDLIQEARRLKKGKGSSGLNFHI
ncbi:MAG: Rrf2 family transcriptional regulator [Candidatus Omnitrophica bacterium]|nr:Rrf2 family transcriptional regulator [Candidatus Omnitrophota bacterium]